MIVAVFKTDVDDTSQAENAELVLKKAFPDAEINFDLEDRDRILRIAADKPVEEPAIALMKQLGHLCQELED